MRKKLSDAELAAEVERLTAEIEAIKKLRGRVQALLRQRRYMSRNPEKIEAAKARAKERYRTDPEFRARNAARSREYYRRLVALARAAQP